MGEFLIPVRTVGLLGTYKYPVVLYASMRDSLFSASSRSGSS